MCYSELNLDDLIYQGDEFTSDGNQWFPCRDSIGDLVRKWKIEMRLNHWNFRRPIKQTKLGNSL